MNSQPTTYNTFKGYDARPIKGFLMNSNCHGIADEMFKIGQKEGFKVFSPFGKNHLYECAETLPPKVFHVSRLWAQDYWTIAKGKLLTLVPDRAANSIKDFFGLKFDTTQTCTRETPSFKETNNSLWEMFSTNSKVSKEKTKQDFIFKKEELSHHLHEAHISGGNLFIVKNGDKDCILVGESELEKYSIEDIQAMYGAEDVIVLPQMDYHLDLFIRPLDKNRILIVDDSLTCGILREGMDKLNSYTKTLPESEQKYYEEIYNNFYKIITKFEAETYTQDVSIVQEVEDRLLEKGFELIRVPGRIYENKFLDDSHLSLSHSCNYMNANVLKNKNGDLVYITNKSNIDKKIGITPELADKIGFSFEKSFIDSINDYIKSEHIYFISGEKDFIPEIMLPEYQGGIHCVCSEIPE